MSCLCDEDRQSIRHGYYRNVKRKCFLDDLAICKLPACLAMRGGSEVILKPLSSR
ncbi:hypothetical protein J6590_068383 [Homalodisca vitripennis]|nr:hypothetical protein J6590_068383 [Homalodisca vitripennis]